MVEPGKSAESESAPGSADELRLNWKLWTTAAFVLTAVCIASARVGASGLPTECGDVGRPNLDAAVVLALGVAVLSWLFAVYGLLRMRSARWLRLGLACIAVVEVLAWVAALVYYEHRIDLFNGGSCL